MSFTQLLFSVISVALLYTVGVVKIEPFSKGKLGMWLLYTFCFAAGLYSNIRALELTSVGLVIAIRCCLPLCVCVIEWLFMGRSLPNAKSSLSLLGVIATATLYVKLDGSMSISAGSFDGILWLVIWFALLTFQMTYGKHMSSSVKMSQWEQVLYSNLFGIPWTILLFFLTGEHRTFQDVEINIPALTYVGASCIVGLGISYRYSSF